MLISPPLAMKILDMPFHITNRGEQFAANITFDVFRMVMNPFDVCFQIL